MKKRLPWAIIFDAIAILLALIGAINFLKFHYALVNFIFILSVVSLIIGIAVHTKASIHRMAARDKKFKNELNDERNIRIKEKAGWATMKIMNYLILLCMFLFAILKVQVIIVLITAALVISQLIIFIMYSNYYERKI
jgi:general stress protein CsbA